MEPVFDMGRHAIYIWPAYAAFAVIFIAMIVWAARGNAKARLHLKSLENQRDDRS